MGWRYKAGLVLIASVVLIWVTSAEVTQVRGPDASHACVYSIFFPLGRHETSKCFSFTLRDYPL